MNEDLEYLKNYLDFLKIIRDTREKTDGENYSIENFTLLEKYNISPKDLDIQLKRLENQGIIKIVDEYTIENDLIDYLVTKYILTFNEKKFQKLLSDTEDELYGKKPIAKIQENESDFFNISTGRGLIKNKTFRLLKSSLPYMIFSSLCTNDKKLSRSEVIKIMNLPMDERFRTTNTMSINTQTKQIRKTTGLNENELVLNGGDVILTHKLKIKS